MHQRLRVAVTADLHWGHNARGDQATRLLCAALERDPPDVLLLGGDQGTVHHFDECLALFDRLDCRKALVPGNHDLWVEPDDPRGDSLDLYRCLLPATCAAHGFTYLDDGPLLLPEADLGVIGSVNWYDYSWSLERLRREVPNWEDHLRQKRFSRGRHNDARFIRWAVDDVTFTAEVVGTCARHLDDALSQVSRALVVTHHPPFYGLGFPREHPPAGLDGLLWDALCGNATMEALLARHAERVPLVFCGHTHRARENRLGAIRGYNVGGDYGWKRLQVVDWPGGSVESFQFGS
jgi:3',5'-cyclic AMP phosphodiesterase CpdA